MACRPAACIVNIISAVMLLVGFLVLGFPLAGKCSYFSATYCEAWSNIAVNGQTFKILYALGGGFILFAVLGCCLAKTGKMRFRLPFAALLLLLLGTVSAIAVVQAGKGAALSNIHMFDPNKPNVDLNQVLADLNTDIMHDFYHGFAGVYNSGRCVPNAGGLVDGEPTDGSGVFSCPQCLVFENVLTECTNEWVPSPAAEKFLTQCESDLAGREPCQGKCTQAFCQCAGIVQKTIVTDEQFVLYGLIAVCALLFVLLMAACCVQRVYPERRARGIFDQALLPRGQEQELSLA